MRMFGRFFGKKKRQGPDPILSMPLLGSSAGFEAQRIADTVKELFPEAGVVVESDDGDNFALTINESPVFAKLFNEVIPGDEIDTSAAVSVSWPRDRAVEYTAHVVLVAMNPSKIEGAKAATREAAAMMKACNAAGWYVGDATAVHEPQFVLEVASHLDEDDGTIPLVKLWVNVIMTRDEKGTFSASTLGMCTFGHREFEIVGSRAQPMYLREWLGDSAVYVLKSGPVLKHGQTFGRSADEKWPIEVGTSKLGKEGTVIRLGVP